MLELKGKYNYSKIFTDNVDEATISQLSTLLDQEFVKDSKIRIMPDTHAGAGCVIGTTMTITDKIVPNLVGVDIGCGMLAIQLKEIDIDLTKLDQTIRTYVPCGFNIHNHKIEHSLNLCDIVAPVDTERASQSLGTLGGGNHFIEVDRDNHNNLWLVIHTGSRHLGVEVCRYYQNLAWEKCNCTFKNTTIPKELCYLEGEDFDNYINDMKITQSFAGQNRTKIAETIISKMGLTPIKQFDTIHNYIDIENMILRKGSVSAQYNELLIIPMNMRDGSLICVGKGNADWNYSAPHGAGRILSRKQAKSQVSIEEFKDSMKGIYTTCVSDKTLDESPMAYKPMQEIIDNIQDTVDIVDIIKPIYNFKAD